MNTWTVIGYYASDNAVFTDVINHVADAEDAIRAVANATRDGGDLVIVGAVKGEVDVIAPSRNATRRRHTCSTTRTTTTWSPPAARTIDERRLAMTKIDQIVRNWTDRRERLRTTLTDWASKFSDQPAYALARSDSLFDDAAELELIEMYLPWFKGEVNPTFEGDRLAQALIELERDLMSTASSRAASISATSNRMQDARRITLARTVERLRRVAERD